MASGENEREEASPPDGDDMNLLIGWRAGGKKAAGAPAIAPVHVALPDTGLEPLSMPRDTGKANWTSIP